ncbi:H-NS family nucleoid-associated regulatory protein [Ralstonia insidiosa]
MRKRQTNSDKTHEETRHDDWPDAWGRTPSTRRSDRLGASTDRLLRLDARSAAGCGMFAPPAREPLPLRYRNAEGQSWDGHGVMPHWLQHAAHAGRSVEHFRFEYVGQL